MCGRFFLSRSGSEIARHFDLAQAPELAPRYNIAPGEAIPVVRSRTGDVAPTRLLEMRRWGLVSSWAGDPDRGRRPINARAESVAELPMFRGAFACRRGLVPADGFFEWQHRGRSSRPFALRVRGGELFGMAALWERWLGPDDRALDSCTILTTEANGRVRPIHDRMPLILDPVDYDAWLDPALQDRATLERLMRPCPDAWIDLHPVDRRVNDVRNDDPTLVEPERDLFSGAAEG